MHLFGREGGGTVGNLIKPWSEDPVGVRVRGDVELES